MALNEEQQQRFASLSPEQQNTVVGALKKKRDAFVSSATSEDILNSNFDPETKKNLILDKRAFKIRESAGATALDLDNISQVLQREEAVFAAPLLNFVERRQNVFGKDAQPQNVLDAMASGVKGETFSTRRPGGQAEFGDVFSALGIPDVPSNILGLLATEVLPTSRAFGALGGSIARKGAKEVATTSSKILSKFKKGQKKLPYANVFRNKFRNVAETSNLPEGAVAELFESGSNIDSDVVLYAFRHPEKLTEELARDEVLGDIVDSVSANIKNKKLNNPELFNQTSRVPIELADEITSKFKENIASVGKKVDKVKKNYINKLGTEDFLSADELELQIVGILSEGDFLDDTGAIRDLRKNEATKFLNSVLKRVRGVTDSPGKTSKILDEFGKPIVLSEPTTRSLTLQEAFDLIQAIDEEAFSSAVVIDGIRKPLPEVDAVARLLRGRINELVRTTAEDSGVEELPQVFDEFSRLAKVRQNMPSSIRKDVSLSKFIRGVGKKSPEDLEAFNELVNATGAGDSILRRVKKFSQNQAIELTEQFPWLRSNKPVDIQSGLRGILDKPLDKLTAEESRLLEQLEAILDDNFLQLVVDHRVAKAFAAKGNVFRTLATVGLTGRILFPLAGAIAGGPVGLLAGIAASDPRAQRALIKRFPAIKEGAKTTGDFLKRGAKVGAKGAKIGLRQLFQKQEEQAGTPN